MKLGEALSLRAKQGQKLNDLKGRIKNSAITQEGTDPAEDPVKLMEEYVVLAAEHGDLVYRITTTNATTDVDGVPLLKLLHQREVLIKRRNINAYAADAASAGGRDALRWMRTELKYITTLDIPHLRALEDEMNEQIRVLDAQIQTVNWQTDLL